MSRFSEIVFDNKTPFKFFLPKEIRQPKQDQFTSSPLDNLCELAGRVCYDSVGIGRSSVDFHKHIREVKHHSIYKHVNFVFELTNGNIPLFDLTTILTQQPGVYLTYAGKNKLRFTTNLCSLIEWHEYKPNLEDDSKDIHFRLGSTLQCLVKGKASLSTPEFVNSNLNIINPITLVAPLYDKERWISVYLFNVSRGLTHEWIRHSYMAGVSQRSTRYCNEEESPWIPHPAIDEYPSAQKVFDYCTKQAQQDYGDIFRDIFAGETAHGVDKTTARKIAYGAARGVLGNALETKMIYTASLFEWKQIFKQRCTPFADEEIKRVAEELLKEFKKTIL